MPLKLEHLFSEQKCLLTAEAFCVVLDFEKEFHDLTIHPPPLERNAVVHDQPMQEIVDFRAGHQIARFVLRVNSFIGISATPSAL